ncbi:hypothetical protein [Aminobacter ciceronei]|uniref:Uncharacterized protein n=1 Tax=Aminobacter ciceronei TaxID=150723 RepID=A0ABR6CF51_9HYPH|nr:hypothetical protein [Aminobacter ciceronei]MBA8909891.1 hypothetical protein [Aminobacter ciceronei]MBA9023663.1 hypothetical protein [Aminobacter ciceronei]
MSKVVHQVKGSFPEVVRSHFLSSVPGCTLAAGIIELRWPM